MSALKKRTVLYSDAAGADKIYVVDISEIKEGRGRGRPALTRYAVVAHWGRREAETLNTRVVGIYPTYTVASGIAEKRIRDKRNSNSAYRPVEMKVPALKTTEVIGLNTQAQPTMVKVNDIGEQIGTRRIEL